MLAVGFFPKSVIEFVNDAMFTKWNVFDDWRFHNTAPEDFRLLSALCAAARALGFDTTRWGAGIGGGLRVFHSASDKRARTEEIVAGDYEGWRTGRGDAAAKFSTLVFLARPPNDFHLIVTRRRIGVLIKVDIDSVRASKRAGAYGSLREETSVRAQELHLDRHASEGSEVAVLSQKWSEPSSDMLDDFVSRVRAFSAVFPLIPPSEDILYYQP